MQRTIDKEAAGREIGTITSDIVQGRPAYSVEFRERGRNPRIFVAENDDLVTPPEKQPALGLGTTSLRTPMAVQQAIRREIGDGEIINIDMEGLSGPAAIYKVEARKKTGATFELRIGENGKVLEDSRRLHAAIALPSRCGSLFQPEVNRTMPARHVVTTLASLPPGSVKAFMVDTRRIALFNVDGRVYALEDRCTHDGAPLSEGMLDGHIVICPWHNAEFDVTSGKVQCPPATEDAKSFPVFVEGDQIAIEL